MKKEDEKLKTELKEVKEEQEAVKTQEGDQLHKGYNEKNPAQPEGSFTPDSKTGKQ